MAFSSKQIQLNFSLANGQFQGGGNTSTVSGMRVSAQIEIAGAPSFGEAELAVYGMPLDTMQQLATVGPQWNARYKNGIDILAGDADSGMSLIFSGVIYNAYVDGNQQPDVCLRILAAPGVYAAVEVAPDTSINGSADVAGMIQKLAKTAGFDFMNNGVKTKLASPHYTGSPLQQIGAIAQDANIDIAFSGKTCVISPRGKPVSGNAPLISPSTGLVGYPGFVQNRVQVRSLFNPQVGIFKNVQVQSSLTPASGTWQVIKIDYDLESVTPNGNWFMTLDTVPVGTT